MNASTLIEFQDVNVSYNGHPVLDHISFAVSPGAQVAVVGPNGAGKSTLFKTILGLVPLHSGQVLVHCQPTRAHLDCMAYIPQREEVDWHFPITVRDVVMMGRYSHQRWLSRPSRQDQLVVSRCLEQMGITSLSSHTIDELSGGQQQRVFLARALAQEPHILLMDEPLSGVDISTQETTLDLLSGLKDLGVTVLVSTHDLNMAASRFQFGLLLNRRLVAYGPSQQVFTPENVHATFGDHVFHIAGAVVVDECCQPDAHHPETRS